MCIPKDPAQRFRFLVVGGIVLALVLPFWIYGLKEGGIEGLLTQYILISTALMSIIFAVIAIKQDAAIIDRLKQPLFLVSLSLFTDIYAYFLIMLKSSPPLFASGFFSIATILLFAAIVEINLLTAGFLHYLKKQSADLTKESTK